MAKLNWALLKHMFERPNHIRFCAAPPPFAEQVSREQSTTQGNSPSGADPAPQQEMTFKQARLSAGQAVPNGSPSSTVLLCIYHAVGLKYYKYTVGGVNIFFVNLLAVVFFAIVDGFVLLPWRDSYEDMGQPVPMVLQILANRALIFLLSLASVIPLSYFIGMAVASISAQSSIGMGAVINATFGSIIEIILYGIALTQGKGALVEGSIVGSLLAGVLLMPGASMCSGAVRKKEQKFNAKSAGVTSTMLIMAIIGTLTPTLFYQTYGNVRALCHCHCVCSVVEPLHSLS
jgi:Ca2+:H+ antiporter